MPFRISSEDAEPIFDQIYGFWEDIAANEGAFSLNDLYLRGLPRRSADAYLWTLDTKQNFTAAELSELERQVDLINADGYPQVLKDAVSELLVKLRKAKFNANIKSKATNQAIRNVYETKTNQGAAPGEGPANIIRKFGKINIPRGSRKMRKTRKTRKITKDRKRRN